MQGVRHKSREVGSSPFGRRLNADGAGAVRRSANRIQNGNGHEPNPQSAVLKTLPAIPVIIEQDGLDGLGAITHLAANAQFECVGEGFSDRTIRVRSGDRDYVVFREDIEKIAGVISEYPLQRKSNGSPARPPPLSSLVAEILVDSNASIAPRLSRTEISRTEILC